MHCLMPQTKGYKTEEEAVEAWNTWAGKGYHVSKTEYNNYNDRIDRDYPVIDGKLILPMGEQAIGSLIVIDPGGYESPWPKVYVNDIHNSTHNLYPDDMYEVYKLRARWRLIEKNHSKLKIMISELLSNNDADNHILNSQLIVWNETIKDKNAPLFEKNDLRGIDISGLTLIPKNGKYVNLKRINFSYSEWHLLSIENANLYGSTCVGIKGHQIELPGAICNGVNFSYSNMPYSIFKDADLSFTDFHAVAAQISCFDGANFYDANLSSCQLRKSTFLSTNIQNGMTRYADLSKVKWNDETSFEECVFNELLQEQNKDLFKHRQELINRDTIGAELLSSIEIKPGIFGISIDFRRVFKYIKNPIYKGFKLMWRKNKTANKSSKNEIEH